MGSPEIGRLGMPVQFQGAARPASLLRKSILDINQRATATAGCTATFKLCAIRHLQKYLYTSISCLKTREFCCGVPSLISCRPPKKWSVEADAQHFSTGNRSGFPAANLERRQMPGDIVGIEGRPGKGSH